MEKQTKIYNSNRIIKAIRSNNYKFVILKELAETILTVRQEKKKQEGFIKKIYEIVLKNLSSSKKEIKSGIVNQDSRRDYHYYINKTGISIKNHYGTNAVNIINNKFLKHLVNVKKNQKVFLTYLSPQKQIIFKKFMEHALLLEVKEPTIMNIGVEIDWINHPIKIKKIGVNYNHYATLRIRFFEEKTYDESLESADLIHLEVESYGAIEQLYTQIKKVLETELKQNSKELENFKKFLKDMDEKFSNYIMSVETLNELKKGA